MKRGFIYLLLIVFFVMPASCGNGQRGASANAPGKESGFDMTVAGKRTVDNLEVLCRVWGFVKYHHPDFYGEEADRYDADSELFRLMPLVAEADANRRNRILLEWVTGLGEFEEDTNRYARYSGSPYRIQTDPEWTRDSELLGDELSATLCRLRYAARNGNNKYVKPLSRSVANPDFSGEEDYPSIASPDAGYRLLTLFRYWNAIEYFYTNRHLTDRNWDDVLPEYIGRFIACGTDGYHRTLAELVTELNDSHAMLYPSYMDRDAYIQVNAQMIEDKLIVVPSQAVEIGVPIPADVAAWPPLRFGDEIISVNGHPIDSIRQNVSRYVSCSNASAADFRTSVYAFCSTPQEEYEVVFLRDGKRDTIYMPASVKTQERLFIDFPKYKVNKGGYALISDRIGYVDAAQYSNTAGNKIMDALADTKAIIIDLRRYPSDFMIFDFFGRYFVPEPVSHVIFTKPVFDLPGCYREERPSIGYANPEYYRGTVIALVDCNTISQAEYTAMTIQALPNSITVGSTTMGADGNISEIPLPGGFKTFISGIGVYYPDGSETQRCGVRIDYMVTPTVEGVRAGRDEALEKAVKIANSL